MIENLEKKPVEAKMIKIVDTKNFVVVGVENSSKQWNIRHATDNWSDEKPKEVLESSGSLKGFPDHSTPEETWTTGNGNDKNLSVKGILKGK